MQTEYTGHIHCEQLNRERDQITVEDRHNYITWSAKRTEFDALVISIINPTILLWSFLTQCRRKALKSKFISR